MALPACFRLQDAIFPRARAQAARALVAHGWSQTRTANELGVTQAMVSKYVAEGEGDADPLVARLADEVVGEALAPTTPQGPSAWCATLSVGEGRPGGSDALRDLLAAERLLTRHPPLRLAPQIGINVVRALPGAATPEDILAFPGRIVEAGGRLVSPLPPAFGASGHLARCLLALRARDPAILSLASVRGGSDVRARAGRGVVDIRHGSRTTDPDLAFRQAAGAAARPPRTLHDAGGHGIEPCLYLAGPDATSVARRILELDARWVAP